MSILIIWVIFLAVVSYWFIVKKPFLRKSRYKFRLERLERMKEIDKIGKDN